MTCPAEDLFIMPDVASLAVRLEPAHNAIESLLILHKASHVSGLGEWVTRTFAAMTREERERHELVMFGLHYAVLPEQSWPSFPAYVDHLAEVEPTVLRDKLLDTYARMPPGVDHGCCSFADSPLPYDKAGVLSSAEAYIGFLRERFSDDIIDDALEAQAYSLAIDPPRLQELVVGHLRFMWDRYLATEWARTLPMLQDAVAAFRQVDLASMSRLEATRTVIGREPDEPGWEEMLTKAERIIFCPSPHTGPYLGKLGLSKTLWVLFGARLPAGVQVDAPDLSRAEILVRLNALADNNRLHILRLLRDRGEQRSQEIIDQMDLSQSTVSRHLNQLRATGYISERRCGGAKCYQLNPQRIQETLQAVESFLVGQ